jgi:hypothetical protein
MTPEPLTPEEQYRFDERIAISCEGGEPTAFVIGLAVGDVERFREGMKEQEL